VARATLPSYVHPSRVLDWQKTQGKETGGFIWYDTLAALHAAHEAVSQCISYNCPWQHGLHLEL
jgi:hypothetical protein